MDNQHRRCEIFCRVVDNYGDAGVCWRLARQLAGEFGWRVCLHIDRPELLLPLTDRSIDLPGEIDGVVIADWTAPLQDDTDVLIEAFACRMPEAAMSALAARAQAVAWINLEYLSTEAWATDCHLGLSPHPQLPLQCSFFIPGFGSATGGLLREAGLLERRDAWLADPRQRIAFWQSLGGTPDPSKPLISLFAYADGTTERVLERWSADGPPATLVVNEALAGRLQLPTERMGNLEIRRIPFLPQDDFDRLLWSADLNLVRGEDSFVRAFWAAAPFLWQPYRQAEEAHRDKLSGFLESFLGTAEASLATTLERAFVAWSEGDADTIPDLGTLLALRPQWQEHCAARATTTAVETHLAERLARYLKTRLEC